MVAMLMLWIVCGSAVLLGLVMGSFAGATVWRLRAKQLLADKAAGEPYDKAELKHLRPLTATTPTTDRSHCLHCQHVLQWYDLIPLASWVSTKGKCRYCNATIGRFEPLIELGTALAFGIFSYQWLSVNGLHPSSLGLLVLWLTAGTMLVILFAYDLRWFLLPDRVMFPLVILAAIISGLTIVTQPDMVTGQTFVSLGASVMILSGLYLMLWVVSKGRWVGFGDVKLGLVLGLLIIDWRLAFMTLFLANLIGTLIVIPGLIRGKVSRQTQVPFGPLLIIGFFISFLIGPWILAAYNGFSIWLSSTLLML